MGVIRGEVPAWARRDGSGDGDGSGYGYGYGYGDGSGSGDGDGSGYGYGYGDGSGYGYGYGSGYGSGDGYGYGYGYGDGDGMEACAPADTTITADMLVDLSGKKACASSIRAFKSAFPHSGTWPADIDKARAAGLDLDWARRNLGLLLPL